MSDASRAGWHAQHLRHGDAQAGQSASSNTRPDRRRLLKEAMRALDESDAARQAARNPSIVAADTHLNTAFVNDGEGGLRELSPEEGVEPVLEYGDGRIDAVKRRWHPKSFETTTIVSWVPKSLLKEIPDYYPVYDKSGTEIGRRSRWVMPDDAEGKAEVDRWFRETHAHLTEDVLTGGHDAVHGVVWNYDESAVHVHWMCDTLAPVQKDLEISAGPERVMIDAAGEPVVKYKKVLTLDKVVPLAKDLDGNPVVAAAPEVAADQIAGIDHHGYLVGADGQRLTASTGRPVRASEDLKVEAQQMWGQSSEVTETRMVDGVEKQVKLTGATKMSRYQEQYREHLIEAGFDIELEVNPEGTSLDKAAFGASEAEKMAVATEAEKLSAERAELDRRVEYIAEQMERLDMREAALTESERRAEAERQRGYADGLAQSVAAWEAEHGEAYRAQVRGDVEAQAKTQAELIISTAQTQAEEKADRIIGNAQTRAEAEGAKIIAAANEDAKEIKDDAQTEAERIVSDTRDEALSTWEREEKPQVVDAAKKEVFTELAGYKKTRKSEIDAELQKYADERRAEMPEYDREAAVEAMQAARFEAGERRTIPIKMKDGTTREMKANDVLDADAKRLYGNRGRTQTDETVAESKKSTKEMLERGVEELGSAEQPDAHPSGCACLACRK